MARFPRMKKLIFSFAVQVYVENRKSIISIIKVIIKAISIFIYVAPFYTLRYVTVLVNKIIILKFGMYIYIRARVREKQRR